MAVDKEPSIPLVPRLQQTSTVWVRCTIARNVRWTIPQMQGRFSRKRAYQTTDRRHFGVSELRLRQVPGFVFPSLRIFNLPILQHISDFLQKLERVHLDHRGQATE